MSFFAFPWWLSCKESTCNAGGAGEVGSIPGMGRSPGERHDNPLQCSCLENPVDREAWWATVHRVAKSWTQLKWLSMHTWLSRFSALSWSLEAEPETGVGMCASYRGSTFQENLGRLWWCSNNRPANAGDMSSIPDPRRFLMSWSNEAGEPQLLSLCAPNTEACEPRTWASQQEKPPQWEACTMQWAPQQRVASTCSN